MSITIIGMTASGKTTLGKKVAKEIGFDFFDLDEEVEKQLEMEISDMYKHFSVEEITDFFNIKYKELEKLEDTVISTGGFFGFDHDFKNGSQIIFLDISLDLFKERIAEAKLHPELPENKNRRIISQPESEVEKHYNKRHPKYVTNSTDRYCAESNKDLLEIENMIISGYSPKLLSKLFILRK